MQQQFSHLPKNNKYAKITLPKRIRLVELVDQAKLSIAKAAKKIGIKISTAKLIVKKYRTDGTYFEKNSDKRLRLGSLTKATQILTPQPRVQAIAQPESNQTAPSLSPFALQVPAMLYYYPMSYVQNQYIMPQWNFWCPP